MLSNEQRATLTGLINELRNVAISLDHNMITCDHVIYAAMLNNQMFKQRVVANGGNQEAILNELAEQINGTTKEMDNSSVVIMEDVTAYCTMLVAMSENIPHPVTLDDVAVAWLATGDTNQRSGAKYVAKRILQKTVNLDKLIDEYVTEHDSSINPGTSFPFNAETALDAFCDDLLDDVVDQSLVPQDDVMDAMFHNIMHAEKNNIILVGDSGIGKSTAISCMIAAMQENKTPNSLQNFEAYALRNHLVVSGAKMRGDVEGRLSAVFDELDERDGAVLVIDDLLAYTNPMSGIGEGLTTLKEALTNPRIAFVATATDAEYAQIMSREPVLANRFHKIMMREPDNGHTLSVLKARQPYFETHHNVQYSDEALDACITLSTRYMHSKRLPDKAIHLMDAVGARLSMLPHPNVIATRDDVIAEVAKMTGIDVGGITMTDKSALMSLKDNMASAVFGQETAIEAIEEAVLLSKSGLADGSKPIGVYLFSGPTGVGKTELAKTLAKTLSMDLVRLDMAEYSERHSISKLIGSPPGYVGYDKGTGGIIGELEKTPSCILLLDEVEKAHQDIYNIFLSAFDYGYIRVTTGQRINMTNMIIIMTTNAGAAENGKPPIGFNRDARVGEDTAAINSFFTPEFRNRITATISFTPLGYGVMVNIAKKMISNLNDHLRDKGIVVNVSEKAIGWLVDQCSNNMNGREVSRTIDRHIKRPLARHIIFNGDQNTVTYNVSPDGNGLIAQ